MRMQDSGRKTSEQKCRFTAVYDWLATRTDLTWVEKAVIAHVLRYDTHGGCYKTNATLARDLGLDRSTIIRTLGALSCHKDKEKDWIAILYPARRERILYVNKARLSELPLFTGVCGKPVKSAVKSGPRGWWRFAARWWQVAARWWQPAARAPQIAAPLNRKSTDLSYSNETDERAKDLVNFSASVMTEMKQKGSRLSTAEFERRRQQMRKDLNL